MVRIMAVATFKAISTAGAYTLNSSTGFQVEVYPMVPGGGWNTTTTPNTPFPISVPWTNGTDNTSNPSPATFSNTVVAQASFGLPVTFTGQLIVRGSGAIPVTLS
jgi:hypothetical protein